MLSRIGYGTFIFFGFMNILSYPIIYLLYPETAGRTLEEVNLLFTSDSLLVSKNMEEFHRRIAEANGSAAVAARRLFDEVNAIEDGHMDVEKSSQSSDKASEEVQTTIVEKI